MTEIDNFKRIHVVDGEGVGQQIHQSEPDNLEITENPLTNVVVLDVIFDHLPKWSWRSARLVNKTWHSGLQPRWRDQMNYLFGVEDYYKYFGSQSGTFTVPYLEQQHPANNPDDPLELGRHPIRNIIVWQFKENQILLQPDQTRFWELYGHGLKSLQLVQVPIYETALLKRLLFELTPSLEEFRYDRCEWYDLGKLDLELNSVAEYFPPATLQNNLRVVCLKTLKYSPDEWRNDDYIPRFPIGWIQFFSAFPNIQKLVLDIDPVGTERPSDLVKLFEAIDLIRNANNNEVLNITELHTVDVGFAEFDATKIGSLLSSLPISILDMDVSLTSNDKTIRLLQTFKSTLRQLKLVFYCNQEREDLPADVFPKGLTKLCLEGPLVSSFEFLMYLPRLEELEVHHIPCIIPHNVNRVVDSFVTLKKFEYGMYYTDPVTDAQIEVVAKLMSNVTECDMDVYEMSFRGLCRGLVNLEHLIVRPAFKSEDIFVENLILLKRLRSLRITSCGFKITNKSIFEGFLRIPSLNKIQLSSFAPITEEGLQALEGKLFRYD